MVRVQLKRSRLLAVSLTLTHCAAAATVFPLDAGIQAKAALIASVIVSLVRVLYRHALLRSPRSVVELEIHDQEKAAIRTRRTAWRDARILSTSCVTPSLTVLNLRTEDTRPAQHVLLVRDNVDEEAFRRIRVLLRWARPEPLESGHASIQAGCKPGSGV
jgi:toxin CptA